MNAPGVRARPLGRFTRGVAWVLGPIMLLFAVFAVVMMVVYAVDGRWYDMGHMATGLLGFPLGILMIGAARTGRDTATEAIRRLVGPPGPSY